VLLIVLIVLTKPVYYKKLINRVSKDLPSKKKILENKNPPLLFCPIIPLYPFSKNKNLPPSPLPWKKFQ
jgi:hypothetical protein